MKNIWLTAFFLTVPLCQPLTALADEQPVLSQPGPANDMEFERLHPEDKPVEKTYPKINLVVNGIEDGKPIPDKFAYCAPDKGRTINGGNMNPAINWSGAPADTKSFVLMVVDPDVPTDFTNANKPGKELPIKMPRQDFYHWVLVNISPALLGIAEGADSKGIVPGGKPAGKKGYGLNGKNDYAKVFSGTFGGYDGPCPPWNDLRLHHYHFIVYALDIPAVDVKGTLNGTLVKSAIQDHIIAKGEVVGTYSNNPRWLAQFDKDTKPDPEMIPGEHFDPKAQ